LLRHGAAVRQPAGFGSEWDTLYNLYEHRRSQWPRGLGHGSATAHLPIASSNPAGAWMPLVGVVCCTGIGLCVGLITRPEESYTECDVPNDCDREGEGRPWPGIRSQRHRKKKREHKSSGVMHRTVKLFAEVGVYVHSS